jgi:hypothetical protein
LNESGDQKGNSIPTPKSTVNEEKELAFCVGCGKEAGDARFCSSCGRAIGEVAEDTAIVTGQPVTTKFCMGCGRGLVASAIVCPSCGTSSVTVGNVPGVKDKTVAILLAVFLGHWTWLYTYQKDQQKFWITTGLWILGLVLLIVFVGFFLLLGIYIWAIVDVAQKPQSYYSNFPNG